MVGISVLTDKDVRCNYMFVTVHSVLIGDSLLLCSFLSSSAVRKDVDLLYNELL